MNAPYLSHQKPSDRAQAIVEFAIVLPILMMILLGVFEVGRMVYIYSAVNNASREAVRFGSAVGYDDSGYHKYKDCAGIRTMARRSAYFLNLQPADIVIEYDKGPGTSSFVQCDAPSGEDPDVSVSAGDRVKVTVIGSYSPLMKLIPISSRSVTSLSARTIVGLVDVGPGSSGGASIPGGGGGGGGATSTPTPTATPSPTATFTATATATSSGPGTTPTSFPTNTPTATIAQTNTPTITPTPTLTSTPTMTFTPTPTATPKPGCDSITAGSITINSKTMSMTITNPHDTVTVASVQVTWNALTGGPGKNGSPVNLLSSSLGGVSWSGSDSSGNFTVPFSTPPTIPGNNRTSTITFTFDAVYQNTTGTSITITLSTAGCENVIITRP